MCKVLTVTRSPDKLTVNIQSRSTCDHSRRVRGDARVLSFVFGKNSGNLQLADVTVMRHPEDVRLSELPGLTEPRDLQIWTQQSFPVRIIMFYLITLNNAEQERLGASLIFTQWNLSFNFFICHLVGSFEIKP